MTFQEIVNYKIVDTESFTLTLYHVFIIILTIFIVRLVLALIKRFFNRTFIKSKIDSGKTHSIYQILKYIIWVFAVGLILDTVGIDMTILVAGSAALFVGIGLGLQQIFKDIVGGIILLFEESLTINDIIEVDGVIGKVKQTRLRTTKILTRDNIIMIIPNSRFMENKVTNWSHMDEISRFSVKVGVAYGSDVKIVEQILLKVASQHDEISKKHDPFVRFTNFGDSSLDFELFFWSANSFYIENIKSDLRFEINREFLENNVSIPFPQRDVHLIQS